MSTSSLLILNQVPTKLLIASSPLYVILLPLNNPFSIFQFMLQLLHCFAYPSNAVVERVEESVHRSVNLGVHGQSWLYSLST